MYRCGSCTAQLTSYATGSLMQAMLIKPEGRHMHVEGTLLMLQK